MLCCTKNFIIVILLVYVAGSSSLVNAQTKFSQKSSKQFTKSLFDSSATYFKIEHEGLENCKTLVDAWYTCSNPDDIIHCMGNVGIGPYVCVPQQKLEIAHNDLRGGIILNRVNGIDEPCTNEIYFQHNYVEQWAIGNDFQMQGKDDGKNFFIWDHNKRITRIYIDNTGVGINDNISPVTDFDVKGSIRSSALGNGYGKVVQTDVNGILINTSISSLQTDFNYWHKLGNDVYRTSMEGKVFIGMNPCTTACASTLYKLYVSGGIVANDVLVTATSNPWPDFVFHKNYQLRTINELERYIKEKKHLPNIPSNEEVLINNGIEVGKLQTELLQTIEEQTLYIINIQKQLDELKQEIITLKNK